MTEWKRRCFDKISMVGTKIREVRIFMTQKEKAGEIDDMKPKGEGGSGQVDRQSLDAAGSGGSKGSERGVTGGNGAGYGNDTKVAEMGWESVHGKGAETEGGTTGDNSETRTTGGMTGGSGSSSNMGGAGGSGSGSGGGGGS
jgi:hypothetical protein